MPRVKRGTVRRAKRKKLLGLAKGYYANKSKLYRAAKESVDTALKYAFVGRRRKKRDFRRLWVIRINAAAREHGLTYGQFINGLKNAGVTLDRKSLSELAIASPGGVRHPRRSRPRPRRKPPARASQPSVTSRPSAVDSAESVAPRTDDGRLDDRRSARPCQTPDRPRDSVRSSTQQLRAAHRVARRRSGRPRPLPRPQEQRRRVVDAEGSGDRAARPEGASIGTLANELQAGESKRGSPKRRAIEESAARSAAAGGIDVTLPGRVPPLGHRHPAHDRPRPARRHLHAHGLRGRRRTGSRRRVALLRRAEHAGGASRARHAGHAVPRRRRMPATRRRTAAHAAAHAHLVDADPLHAGAPAADSHRRAGPRLSARRSRPDALAGVRPDRRPGRRRRAVARRSRRARCWRSRARCSRRPCASGSVRASSRTPSRAPKSTSAAGNATAPAVRCARRPAGSSWAAAAWCIPAVFEAVGYDAERYTGFAWGIGIERIAILRYQVEDIRLFYENDLRFLEQFPY